MISSFFIIKSIPNNHISANIINFIIDDKLINIGNNSIDSIPTISSHLIIILVQNLSHINQIIN